MKDFTVCHIFFIKPLFASEIKSTLISITIIEIISEL